MRQINQYIYNNVNDLSWEKRVCGQCGFQIVDVKGVLVRMVVGVGAPQEVFKANTAYFSIICRKCHTRNNMLVISYDGPIEIPISNLHFAM